MGDSTPDLPDELIRTNAILGKYAAIHDAIFKFSWRRTLPIPGIFKATDFGAHFKDLNRLASKLAPLSLALKTTVRVVGGFPPVRRSVARSDPSTPGDLQAVS